MLTSQVPDEWGRGESGGWRGLPGGGSTKGIIGNYESCAMFWYELVLVRWGGGSKYYADIIQLSQYKVFYFYFF